MKIFLLILLMTFFSVCSVQANDSLTVQQLVSRIYKAQVQHEPYFPKGLFPVYRMYYYNRGALKNDDNSFFTGLILFTLRTLQPYLDTASQQLCDSIFAQAVPAFKKF